jgi:hypothetical protein
MMMMMSFFASYLQLEQVLRAPAAPAADDGDGDDEDDLASSSQVLGCYCFCPTSCHEYVVEC